MSQSFLVDNLSFLLQKHKNWLLLKVESSHQKLDFLINQSRVNYLSILSLFARIKWKISTRTEPRLKIAVAKLSSFTRSARSAIPLTIYQNGGDTLDVVSSENKRFAADQILIPNLDPGGRSQKLAKWA